MFKKILLAADGSSHSKRAAEKAIFLAKKTEGSSVTLIHVIDDIPGRTEVLEEALSPGKVPDHHKERTASIEKSLEDEGVTYEVQHIFGEPGPSIIRNANNGDYDIVVIGSRGLNPFQEMVLGSVSHKVAKRADCPVMIVK